MTDGQLALKATKVAGCAFLGLAAFVVAVGSLTAGAVMPLGPLGAGALYLLFLFSIIWICAALDVQGQEDRKAAASVDGRRMAETENTGLAEESE